MTLGAKLNNPGNIKSGPVPVWQGQTGSEKGFARFSSPLWGVRAGLKLLVNYHKKGFNTLRKILDRYAPKHGTTTYLNFLVERTGISPDQVFSPTPENFKKIFSGIMVFEIGKTDSEKFQRELDPAWMALNDSDVNFLALTPILNYILSGGLLLGGIFVLLNLINKLRK